MNLEIIIRVNSELLNELETYNTTQTGSVGRIFLTLAPFLKVSQEL